MPFLIKCGKVLQLAFAFFKSWLCISPSVVPWFSTGKNDLDGLLNTPVEMIDVWLHVVDQGMYIPPELIALSMSLVNNTEQFLIFLKETFGVEFKKNHRYFLVWGHGKWDSQPKFPKALVHKKVLTIFSCRNWHFYCAFKCIWLNRKYVT